MKKAGNPKSNSAKKSTEKGKDIGELKKPTKLKPLKEKEKKNWKNNWNDEDDEDFSFESDLDIDKEFDEDEDEYYDDDTF